MRSALKSLILRGLRKETELNKFLYRLYNSKLRDEISRSPLPEHIGIILDGNRRHAKEVGEADLLKIYQIGADKLDEVLDWCAALSVKVVTLWVCSTDNLARSEAELSGILPAIERKIRALASDPRLKEWDVRVAAIGRQDLLPLSLQEALRQAGELTRNHQNMQVNIAVGYGGREEITDAVKALLQEAAQEGKTLQSLAQELTPEQIGRFMYLSDFPYPDLIIRTGGEIRLSGFMLWQSVYSEFYFTDVNWPAFRYTDFLRAVRGYQKRDRRFGR